MPSRRNSWRSIHFNIIVPPLPSTSKWSLSVRSIYPSKPLMHLSGLLYVPHELPPHTKLILLDLITRIIYDEDHRRNLAKSTGGREKSTMGIRNFNLWRSEVTKRGKSALNQPLLYINPFPLNCFFYLHLFQLRAKKSYF